MFGYYHCPALRQRIREDPGELDDLLSHTVERIAGNPSPELADMVKHVISAQLGSEYPWPGNVRELEQCVRRILLKRQYEGDYRHTAPDLYSRLAEGMEKGNLDAQSLLSGYCTLLWQRLGTYEAVSRQTGLDRRTVKKHILEWQKSGEEDVSS